MILSGGLFCVAVQDVRTQKGFTVSETVTDVSREPFAGVNIVRKDASSIGTITDADRKYSLQATGRNVSYLGILWQDAVVSGNVLNVTTQEDTQTLEEVVVVG
jgi:hypothetical protein